MISVYEVVVLAKILGVILMFISVIIGRWSLFALAIVITIAALALKDSQPDQEQVTEISKLYNKKEYESCKKYVNKEVVRIIDANDYFDCVKNINDRMKYQRMRGEIE